MRSKLVGSCIVHQTVKWFSQNTFGLHNLAPKHLNHHLQRDTTECLINVLPMAKNSVSCNSLLHLLKVGLTIKINSELLKLQKNCFYVGSLSCSRSLVKNNGDNDNGYSVGIVIRVVESYVTFVSSKPAPKIFSFGRLIDSYLTLVARHKNLSPTSFQSLAEKLPKDSQYCDDNLHRTIDMYPKVWNFFHSQ